jgi:hypothetical protein
MVASNFSTSLEQNLNNPIHLDISLNEETYKAGGKLTGKVNLSVLGSNDLQPANTTIYLTLKGTEFIQTFVLASEMTSDKVVNLKVPITTTLPGRIPPGHYEYPFQCTVPANWQTSLHFINEDQRTSMIRNFGIRYTISAGLKHLDPQSGALLDCLATESLIIAGCTVAELPLDNSTYIVIEPEFFPIRNCCYYKGSMSLGFDVSSTVLARNTFIDIGILGKNMSVVDVQYLKAELVQIVKCTCYGHIYFRRNIIAQTYIGASPAWSPLNISTFLNGDHRYTNPTLSEMEASRVQGHLRVPSDAMESYQGHIIQITHTLVITAVTTGTFFVQSPRSSISVHVQQNAPLESNADTLDYLDYLANTDHQD